LVIEEKLELVSPILLRHLEPIADTYVAIWEGVVVGGSVLKQSVFALEALEFERGNFSVLIICYVLKHSIEERFTFAQLQFR